MKKGAAPTDRAFHFVLFLTRLAQGIPLGSEVKFIDKETLNQSFMYRQCL